MSTTPIFLAIPPFTQLNTPYPSTAYLKGFLNTKGIASVQADLGIDVILALFSAQGLRELFEHIAQLPSQDWSENSARIIALQKEYIHTIEAVIRFLQGQNPTLANLIAQEDYLPQAGRFAQQEDLDWAFGAMGFQDKAKHLATLYLEDLSDLIIECVDEHFGFSRYAERLGRSANQFDELYATLHQEPSYIDRLHLTILDQYIKQHNPLVFGQSVPFPGNLYASFRAAQWVKTHYPHIKTVMGGGFANTELRSLKDARVFEFFDFILLDDGEKPLEYLLEHIQGTRTVDTLLRTYTLDHNKEVIYYANTHCKDYSQAEVGTPDYCDLRLKEYISVIEVVNPMHRLWSDGRWNKLTMAHGCYWGKCTFCDISLDYIKVYEPVAAKLLCDRMEELIAQTGETGFHFVDEAAPPALMRALAIEILRRGLTVNWWTNIRFEKSFTADLCQLLAASGCIAVSGGLEVASDRLLALIQKGVTVAQVAQVNRNFTEAGIMVHAYLMYGFPTQTAQETIDSLEMVRQMFELGILQSGFWHQFAMTAHSPVGLEPEKFKVIAHKSEQIAFADNDVIHEDPTGADHELFSYGLKKSLFNFMHGIGFEEPLGYWFDFKVPRTKIAPDYIANVLEQEDFTIKPNTRVLWLGTIPTLQVTTKTKKGKSWPTAILTFHTKKETTSIQISPEIGQWLVQLLPKLSPQSPKLYTLKEIKDDYLQHNLDEIEDFEIVWFNKPLNTLESFLYL